MTALTALNGYFTPSKCAELFVILNDIEIDEKLRKIIKWVFMIEYKLIYIYISRKHIYLSMKCYCYIIAQNFVTEYCECIELLLLIKCLRKRNVSLHTMHMLSNA